MPAQSPRALKPSEIRKLPDDAFPGHVWTQIDDGAIPAKKGKQLVVLSSDKKRQLWPPPKKKPASASGPLSWTTDWPVEEGLYWYYGITQGDRSDSDPRIRTASAEVFIEQQPDSKETREVLRILVDGQPIERRWPTRGVWAPLEPPEPPEELFEKAPIPERPEVAAQKAVHGVYGGQALCGYPKSKLRQQNIARSTQLGSITCPECRVRAEAGAGSARRG